MAEEGNATEGEKDAVADLLRRIRLALKGFGAAPAEPASLVWKTGGEHFRFPVDPKDLPVPLLPRFVLALAGAQNMGPGDKVAWEYIFTFEGSECALSLQKYGLRLYVGRRPGSAEKEALQASRRIVSRLKKAQQIVEKSLLSPRIELLMAAGEFAITNQAPRLRGMYKYFRDRAFEEFSTPPQATPLEPVPGRPGMMRQSVKGPLFRQVTGFYNTFAMVTAYTSWLEHVLVLLLPFIGGLPPGAEIKKFIGDRWSAKFQKVFDMKDRVAKGHYDTIHAIVEYYRNPYSHGGFDKAGSTISVFFPGLGALPLTMSDVRDSPTFDFTPAGVDGFTSICSELDRVDGWLESGATEIGMIWINEGLDVRFDKEFADLLTSRSADVEEFQEWVFRSSLERDRMENMEGLF
ncbi:hypothetical protein ACQPYA_02215 [Micromonospora sp. CA-263727]|uniref:hypothetical protein n=1 Tax=Micromonospora sp. CA-263727 TaxID=3239967 RepID=UPI003D8F283D